MFGEDGDVGGRVAVGEFESSGETYHSCSEDYIYACHFEETEKYLVKSAMKGENERVV